MKFTRSKASIFKKVGIKGWNYGLSGKYDKVNISLVKTSKGHETIIKSTKHPWIYFVIDGKGKFWINGLTESCKKDDLIYVPKNASFYYRGKLKMLLITVPPWDDKHEETLGKVSDLPRKLIDL